MPDSSQPLRKLGFLTIGLFDPAEPAAGHESTLQVIALGEQLGFDSAWLRHRHLQFGISSPIAVMAAASQRTSRIELGTAVTPMGWENPLRLAEDLATVDLLAGGRINPGLSVGEPMHYETVKHELYPDSAELEDFGYARLDRLARLIAGEPVREFSGKQGVVEEFSNRVEPHSAGLRARLWYGAASRKSAIWAGANGFNLLSSSVIFPETDEEPAFAQIQQSQIRAYREAAAASGQSHGPARVSQGLWSSRPIRLQRNSGKSTGDTSMNARPAPGRRRDQRACCSPRTSWAPAMKSPSNCTHTRGSARSTKWRSRCRSASTMRTTSRSSPTSPPDWVPLWDGLRHVEKDENRAPAVPGRDLRR